MWWEHLGEIFSDTFYFSLGFVASELNIVSLVMNKLDRSINMCD